MTDKEYIQYYRESMEEIAEVLKTISHRNKHVLGTRDVFLKSLQEILAHRYHPGANKKVRRNDN